MDMTWRVCCSPCHTSLDRPCSKPHQRGLKRLAQALIPGDAVGDLGEDSIAGHRPWQVGCQHEARKRDGRRSAAAVAAAAANVQAEIQASLFRALNEHFWRFLLILSEAG